MQYALAAKTGLRTCKNEGPSEIRWGLNRQVGAPGFEPGTSCSQSRRDTGLRYAPKVRASYYTRPSARNAFRSARKERARWLEAAVFLIDDSAKVPPSSGASK